MYQLCGGYLPYDGINYLKPSQRKVYQVLTSDYDKSKFIDSAIEARVKKGSILDFDSLLPFTPMSIKKIIKKATHLNMNKRYRDCSEFELALHKIGQLPDWAKSHEGYCLYDYNDKDFRVVHRKNGTYCCEKSSCGSGNWRKDGKIDLGSENKVVGDMSKLYC